MQGGGWGPPGGPPGGPPPGGFAPQNQPQPQAPYGQPPYGQQPQPGYGAPPTGGYGQPMPGAMQQQPFGPAFGPGPMAAHGFTTCPRCNSPHLTRPSFTWWGGLIGPKLLNHTVCSSCSYGFNGKTGKNNATAIGIYLGVGVFIAILLVILQAAAH